MKYFTEEVLQHGSHTGVIIGVSIKVQQIVEHAAISAVFVYMVVKFVPGISGYEESNVGGFTWEIFSKLYSFYDGVSAQAKGTNGVCLIVVETNLGALQESPSAGEVVFSLHSGVVVSLVAGLHGQGEGNNCWKN